MRIPAWYRTPLAQTVVLGLVFLLLFAAYTTIQFYASATYGPTLAANSVSALYATFTCACFVAPSFVNKWKSRQSMAIGILGGYVMFVLLSLAYFHGFVGSWAVMVGGVLLGLGAALLWTAQGRLILQYAAIVEHQKQTTISSTAPPQMTISHPNKEQKSGMLLGVFWAVFQCSSLVGGSISLVYYSKNPDTDDENNNNKPTGSTLLYIIFLAFMILSALLTQALLPPSTLLLPPLSNKNTSQQNLGSATEDTALLVKSKTDGGNNDSDRDHHQMDVDGLAIQLEGEEESWMEEARDTLLLFTTHRPMMILSLLFFYTGFNQPYQQATFTRFFTKRAIGIELILFHAMEIVGGVLCGRLLDRNQDHAAEAHDSSSSSGGGGISSRRVAVVCLAVFLIINTVGNGLAMVQEYSVIGQSSIDKLDIDNSNNNNNLWAFLQPSLAFLCWGFADAQIQVYCYWLMGKVLDTHAETFSRAVAFYKCLQSLGYTLGFYWIPTERLSAVHQLGYSSVVFIGGTTLAFFQLPPSHHDHHHQQQQQQQQRSI